MAAQRSRESEVAQTIDEIIAQLDEVIARARHDKSRMGYFAVLYRNVTIEVKRGIAQGRFEDGPRMEKLDVTFANRYLSALRCYERGEATSKCWVASFKAASQWPPIVLQHLLLGMNAHINLDLGAAAAQTCPGDQLPPLKRDFNEINSILSAMVGGVQWQLSQISVWMKVLDLTGARLDDAIVNFSIDRARDFAWAEAERLAWLTPAEMNTALEKQDEKVDLLARLIRYPGIVIGLGNLLVRVTEPRSVVKIIDILT